MFDSPSHAYRLGVGETGAIEAFAILRGLGDAHANLYLKRVAVARPGQGLGAAFLAPRPRRGVRTDWAPNASISTASPTTPAPKRAYLKLGFTRDGVLRKAYRGRDGTRADLVLMAILKSEWEGRRQNTTMNHVCIFLERAEARELWVWTGLAPGWICLESFVGNERFQGAARPVGGLSLLVPLSDRLRPERRVSRAWLEGPGSHRSSRRQSSTFFCFTEEIVGSFTIARTRVPRLDCAQGPRRQGARVAERRTSACPRNLLRCIPTMRRAAILAADAPALRAAGTQR